ncbi:Gfo/Idh/MocA family protein [Ruegeria arenilitoris]|uniref:Gfo/Idh/MocA family protein n=1 Tax=Ruegeria arenilitoris TaxID=1173585 RepID=UPI00147D8FDF
MSSQQFIRVACVGAGYFSQFHYGSWRRIPQVQLVAACDRDLEKAAATGLPAYDDLPSMLARESPQLLDIILPPEGHADAIRAALDAGVGWILCQKPFCLSLAEAEAVLQDARDAGATVVVHENFRFQPWYRVMKDALTRGDIGTPLQAMFRLRPGDGQGPRAYLDRQPYFQKMPRFLIHETAVHWVDTFRFLFGNPISVYADLRRINPVISGEDAGYVIFEFENGLRAVFDGNRNLDHASDNLRRTMGEALIEGTGGTMTMDGFGAVRLREFGSQSSVQLLAPDKWEGFGGDCVHTLQQHVISGLLNGTHLENTGPDYLDVIRIEQAIYRSDAEGRKIVLEAE